MGTGKTDNYTFYEGYEGEIEIEFSADDDNMETIHIWEGYFDDIFRFPSLDGKGWFGFTRDYHQCVGAFGDMSESVISNLQEYIDDLRIYMDRQFDHPETRAAYKLIYFWLNEANDRNCGKITVKVL